MAQSRGFDVEAWRAWHRARGERYRWFKAVPAGDPRTFAGAERDGRLYVEQEVDAAWRALVQRTTTDISDPHFGLVPRGSATISVMPGEAPLARFDRIILTERRLISRVLLNRSADDDDRLICAPAVEIAEVRRGAVVYRRNIDYELANDAVRWLGEASPPAGEAYSVEYFYQPTYVFIGQQKTARPGSGAALMPIRGALLLQRPSEP